MGKNPEPLVIQADPQKVQKSFSEVHTVKGGDAASAQAIHDSKQEKKR